MNYNSVKTIHLDYLNLCRSRQLDFSPLDYSTLNEKHGILAGESVPSGKYPIEQWVAIGRGGHANVAGNGGAALQDVLQHSITDAALFDQIPWRLEEITNPGTGTDDLDLNTRLNYRLRKQITVDNVDYNAYYLKKLPVPASLPEANVLTTENGDTTSAAFVPSASMLTPTPVQLQPGQTIENTGKHISVRLPNTIVLLEDDIDMIVEACEIIYGDAAYATISELALVSGHDVDNLHASYPELIAAQCCNFIGTNIPLSWSRDSVTFNFDIGDTQPQLL